MPLLARFQTTPDAPPQIGHWEGDRIVTDAKTFALAEVILLPPCTPTKIIGVGRNYRDHAKEMGNEVPTEPLLFMKAPSALVAQGAAIVLPRSSSRVDYEGELGVVIGQVTRNITPEEAPTAILGYTCGNDVTARDYQKKDGQWTRAKGFDSFCPLGPFLFTGELDLNTVIETRLNGQLVQQAPFSDMVFSPYFLVAHISQCMTLYPGDVILTGTPAGVGALQPGDWVEITIPGIGTLKNPAI
jgi:2-keto-4-pentenoate hydratase/2-oxohepta-3-ene-1,7-dioic acid hydratase in catechol pathway